MLHNTEAGMLNSLGVNIDLHYLPKSHSNKDFLMQSTLLKFIILHSRLFDTGTVKVILLISV